MDTSIFAPIFKRQEQDDGSLMIYGKATGSDLDLDQQRCDPDWLKRAMPEWFKIGNIREQHDSKRAVGKATEHEVKADGHYIKAHIVDPVAVAKTKAGVFTGLSIGIMKPRVEKSADGEWVRDGLIGEVSLCDRPCLPTATFTMCKTATAGMEVMSGDFDQDRGLIRCQELVERKIASPSPLNMPGAKKKVAATEVSEEADDDVATKVTDTDHLEAPAPGQVCADCGAEGHLNCGPTDVVKEFDRTAAEALVARTLEKDAAGSSGDGLGQDESDDISGAEQAIAMIAQLIVAEAQAMVDMPAEDCDIHLLMRAADAMRVFSNREKLEAGAINPSSVMFLAVGANALPYSVTDRGELVKAKYSADQLASMLKDGKAMRNPNGDPSYPIGDKEDLSNAIHAVGRGSGDHDAIRAYIKKRASALGASDMIPENWSTKAVGSDDDAEGGAETVTKAVELDPEPTDETTKAAVVDAAPDGDALVKAFSAQLEKADSPLRKSFEAIIEAATETTAKSVTELTERLVKVEQMATPGGPTLRRSEIERAQSRKKDLDLEVMRYQALSSHAEDPNLRKGYADIAAKLTAEAKVLDITR